MGFFRKPAAAEAGPRIIGIVGTGRGAGATHLCVWSANGLRSGLGRKTAVLEWNRHGDFDRFGRVCTGMEPRNLRYSIQGVDFYPQSGEEILAACIRGPYQEILLDCGVLGEEGDGGLLYCRSVYLLTSFSEWQEGAFGSRNHWEERARQNGWHCLAAFGSEESRRNWNRRRKPFVDRIPFSADAFSVSAEDIRWIRNMLDQDFSR